jgi:hypothetical protein
MMTKRNRNIINIFIMLQMGTNIMANQVKTPIQNYFEKVLCENLTFEILPLWFLARLFEEKSRAIVVTPASASASGSVKFLVKF